MTKVTHLTLDEGGGLNRRRIHLREISGEADTPLETVGQDLRAARLRRGDDLATAAKILKIRKDHLEALEEDRLDSLPGRTYAIGFVRSYADYLGLDAVEAVERFKNEIAGRDEGPRAATFHDPDEDRRLPHGWVVIAIVVLVLVIYGAYRLARSADSLLNEPVAPVPARMVAQPPEADGTATHQPAPKTAKPAQATPAPSGDTTAKPPISGSLIAPDDGTKAKPQSGLVGAPPMPDMSASTPAAGAPAVTPAPATPEQATTPPPEQKGRVYGVHNVGARVILHVEKPTRVLVEGPDGFVYINRLLSVGDSYRVPDHVGLTLTTSDAAAVEVELDGQAMGAAGRKNQILEALPLDPQAIADRYYGR